jgi:hypothetical protein
MIIYSLIGIVALYATGHFFWLQNKAFDDRTAYEKAVTFVAIMCIVLIYIGLIAE